jgi:hypothetical protein
VCFFIDEPTIKVEVFAEFIEFLGIDVMSVLYCQHLALPCNITSEGSWWEEDIAERLHALGMGSVGRSCGRNVDDALRGGAGPIDEFVHVLPVSGLVTGVVVGSLRRTQRTGWEQNGGVADFSAIVLVGVGLHERWLLKTFCQGHFCHIECIVGIGAGFPVLDVIRMTTHV